MPTALIVHGGAWDIPDKLVDAHRDCCAAAIAAGWRVLQDGGPALDAVEEAIRLMEDHPAVDAGVGAFLNAAGEVELDAGLMDGTTLAVGSVAAVQRVRHPISLARRVMESEHVLLVGEGAGRFADAQGTDRLTGFLQERDGPRRAPRIGALGSDRVEQRVPGPPGLCPCR